MKIFHSHPDTRGPVLTEYARLAHRYDRKWSFYIQMTTRETMARMRLRPADALLDVGCGTGALLLALGQTHPETRLAGVDPSPEMLALARAKLPPGVDLRKAWAEQLPFEKENFDVVVSCNVFHYIRHPKDALAEISRVLRPGGRAVITDWCDDYLACRACDFFLRRFNPAHFRVYRKHECLALLEESGMKEVNIERYKISWLWGLMTAIGRKGSG